MPKIIAENQIRRNTSRYSCYGGSADLMHCNAEEVLLEGPFGTGKTRSVLAKCKFLCDNFPNIRILWMRKQRKDLTESVLPCWETEVLPPNHMSLELGMGKARATRQTYVFDNRSEIILGGMDKPIKVLSSQYDVICGFEAREFSLDDWEQVGSRLRNQRMPLQQMIADTNPDSPSHWLNVRANDGLMERLLSRHEDNPTMTEKYLHRMRSMTGFRRKRFYEGLWVAAEGAVYENWEPKKHIIDISIDELKKKYGIRSYVASKDWGFNCPGVTQIWGVDGDKRMYCVWEVYKSKTLISDWIKIDKELQDRFKPRAWVCDPAGAEPIAQYRASKLFAIKGNNDIEVGVQRCEERLAQSGDLRPRMFFLAGRQPERDRSLVEAGLPYSTTEEFANYAWDKKVDEEQSREEPVDKNNHGMDAMRYSVMYVNKYGIGKGSYHNLNTSPGSH